MSERRLVDLSVAEFVEAVASTDHAAPAGGSVSALTGAACAALLELVCGVLERRASVAEVASLGESMAAARRLRGELLTLIDEDAAAVHAWLAAPSGSDARREAGRRAIAVPLDIARRCVEVAALATTVEPHADGSVRFDVAAAQQLSRAAGLAAIDLVEANLGFEREAEVLAPLVQEVARLRTILS